MIASPMFVRLWLKCVFSLSFICIFTDLAAQESSRLKVFLNCNVCDHGYIKTELTYVDYVRDQSLADIQVFVVRMTNGSGGRSYEMSFTGYGDFEEIEHSLKYEVIPNSTSDQIRSGMLKRLEAGLILYLMSTPAADEISIKVPKRMVSNQQIPSQVDPWNNWVFRIYGDGSFNQETSRSRTFWELGFRADRVTEDLRIRTNGELSQRRNKFLIDEEEIISFRDANYFRGSVAKSINNHWSYGAYSGVSHNTYANLDLALYASPAIEYSFFPYSEVAHREITAVYKVGLVFNDYLEETIYFQDQEGLMRQTIAIQARFNQPWGRIWSSLEASHYIHDFSKNSLELDSNISFRIFKGLSARISADVEFINDQLTLPRRGVTLEEVLTQQRQLATNFDAGIGIGLSYTFGSMFNNVVNTRL